MFEQRLVLLPDAVEGGPARASVRQWVLPHPASAGKLVEVLAGVGAAVHRLHDLTGHSDTGLRQAQATPTVCRASWVRKKVKVKEKSCNYERTGGRHEGYYGGRKDKDTERKENGKAKRWRQRNKRKEEAWGRSITRVRRKKGKAEVDRRASGRKGGRRDGKAKV